MVGGWWSATFWFFKSLDNNMVYTLGIYVESRQEFSTQNVLFNLPKFDRFRWIFFSVFRWIF